MEKDINSSGENNQNNATEDINRAGKLPTENKDKYKIIGCFVIVILLIISLSGMYAFVCDDENKTSRRIERRFKRGRIATPERLYYWALGDGATAEELLRYSPDRFTATMTIINLANAKEYDELEKLGAYYASTDDDIKDEDAETLFKEATFDNAKLDKNLVSFYLEGISEDPKNLPSYNIVDDNGNFWNIGFSENFFRISASTDWHEGDSEYDENFYDLSDYIFTFQDGQIE